MIRDELERELMKIEAVADVLVTVEAGELAKHTAAGLGVVILEACAAIREQEQGGKGGHDGKQRRPGSGVSGV